MPHSAEPVPWSASPLPAASAWTTREVPHKRSLSREKPARRAREESPRSEARACTQRRRPSTAENRSSKSIKPFYRRGPLLSAQPPAVMSVALQSPSSTLTTTDPFHSQSGGASHNQDHAETSCPQPWVSHPFALTGGSRDGSPPVSFLHESQRI